MLIWFSEEIINDKKIYNRKYDSLWQKKKTILYFFFDKSYARNFLKLFINLNNKELIVNRSFKSRCSIFYNNFFENGRAITELEIYIAFAT